jgi:predicted aldo/keto reductase-like oxidoreductase
MPNRRVMLGLLGTTVPLAACSKASSDAPPPTGSAAATTAASARPGAATAAPATAAVPRRRLGRTGVEVSAIGLGGYHLGEASDEGAAVRIVHRALEGGITFMDNCWDYHAGKSEEWMGKALEGGKRQLAFLMTKMDGRTKQACTEQLEQSLRRLRTDHIDLVQMHEIIRMEDAEKIFAAGGAMEALTEARKAGKLRFIGFTGHKSPAIHLHMLDVADKHGFAFDTVQMPLNVLDAHYESFEQRVLPRLVSKQIGVLGMKSICSGEALDAGVSAEECLRYALSLPTSVVITGCEKLERVEQAIRVASTFQPLSPAEREQLLARTAPHAAGGKLEPFKTSDRHDGTAKNPHWLTSADATDKSKG